MAMASGIWNRAWEMVEQRSMAADALFVYAKTTGIYCRPSCPSRRPLRTSVEFFTSSTLAEGAGYRACRRGLLDERPHCILKRRGDLLRFKL